MDHGRRRSFGHARVRVLAALLLCALVMAHAATLGADEKSDILAGVPDAWRSGVSSALSGGNGTALRATYAKLDEDERRGWAFLLAHMRSHHRAKLTEPLLTEHLKYAYRARRELPWTKALPEEIFLHYVLPILSGDEPLQRWRKQFFEEVVPVLKKKRAKSLEKVALEVNKWCGQRVTFKPTPAEDSGPLDTLKRGYGRCEEEGIFFNAVARSVGLPARIASTPYWTFKASNHAWCEVYIGKSKKAARDWGFLGACEPGGKLNSAWFVGDAKRAALVLSRAIGTPESDSVLSNRGGYSVINTTRYYTKVCDMAVRVKTAEGEPASNASVTMYVFNEVGNEPYLRSVFQASTDDAGTFRFELGPGDYVVQASQGGETGWAIASSKPGKKATCDIVLGAPGLDAVSKRAQASDSRLRLELGSGAKKTKVGICRLNALPWKPQQFVDVDKAGADVELSSGFYLLQACRRKGDGEVHVVLDAVEVKDGEVVTVVLPGGKPKKRKSRKKGAGPGPVLHVLRYPRP
ncbi:MAG: transglutaminase domain-containing protein [Planctomycetota bacterium]|nr:transglutaminase domain-containing protein [Planctomycetota bacterium]